MKDRLLARLRAAYTFLTVDPFTKGPSRQVVWVEKKIVQAERAVCRLVDDTHHGDW